jgi:tRNA threonylcarbamoyladenosine biosynthesis protein TsaB
MPRALAIETSGRIGSIALAQDDQVISEDEFPHGLKHAAEIVSRIDALFRIQNWKPKDLTDIYVSVGPGSFTGLRIGVTLAKTLAFATGARVFAVPTFAVLSRNAPPAAQHLIIALDAKRGQIFTARLRRAGPQWLADEPAHLDTLSAMLARSPRPVHLLGEGLPFHDQEIPQDDPGIILTPPERWTARASALAAEGFIQSQRSEPDDPIGLRPLYIRLPEAEEKLAARESSSAPAITPP